VKYLGYTIKAGKKLAMLELVDGGSLSSFLSDYGPFNETLMRKYIRQLVEALIYLKGKHIIHGRIRCENILSDINGNVKLTLPRFKSYGVDDEHKSVYWSAPEVLYGEPTS
jgi:mitogen-activated protein kinase kinase kinase